MAVPMTLRSFLLITPRALNQHLCKLPNCYDPTDFSIIEYYDEELNISTKHVQPKINSFNHTYYELFLY